MDLERSCLENESPAELAVRVQRGDPSAEEDLVRRFRGRIRALVLARTRDPEIADELVNDSLMAVLTSLRKGTIRDAQKLPAFVYQTSLNLVNNYLRSRSRRPCEVELSAEIRGYDPQEDYEAAERRELVQQAMTQLIERDRQILTLSLAGGLDPIEIAGRLGLTTEAVRQRKSRALKRLRTMLSPGDGKSRGSGSGSD